jgi:2'-5' RNA ligase
MLKRVFIAINLPEDIKNQLTAFQKRWPTLPIRWTKKENIHITLLFLGYLDQKQLLETIETTKRVAQKHKPFSVLLEKICYGPNPSRPRMVWVALKRNPELIGLQRELEESIFSLASFKYKEREKRDYSPHITLGRLKRWEFQRLEDRPEIEESVSLDFLVNSIEVMESQLKRDGAKYSILESCNLKHTT